MGKTARLLQAQPIFTLRLTAVMLVTETAIPLKCSFSQYSLALLRWAAVPSVGVGTAFAANPAVKF
jgi:hypothetical protein